MTLTVRLGFVLSLAIVPTAARSYAAEVVNSLGMKLVEIPAGEFVMGSDESPASLREALALKTEPDVADERPPHRVRITRSFYLGAYDVTVGEFRKFVEATGYKTTAETDDCGGIGPIDGRFGRSTDFTWDTWWKDQTDRHPVVNVSWNDSVAFCEWLTRESGPEGPGYIAGSSRPGRYRLPTEAEWEYACRAGTTTRFYSGDDVAGLAKIANFADPQRHPPGTVLTLPVGSLAPNAWGLYDMSGNIWQWVADYYQPDYYATSPTDDPPGPAKGGTHVLRGGCWGFPIETGRSAGRGRGSFCGYRDGFRVVCEKQGGRP